MTTLRRSLWLALIGLLPGCEACMDAYNARGLSADLPRLVAPTGVTLTGLSCRMVSGTRTGYCIGEVAPGAAEQVRAGLAMTPAAPSNQRPHPDGCRAQDGFEAAPTFYRALTGTGYVYTSLHIGQAGRICMELEYGYG